MLSLCWDNGWRNQFATTSVKEPVNLPEVERLSDVCLNCLGQNEVNNSLLLKKNVSCGERGIVELLQNHQSAHESAYAEAESSKVCEVKEAKGSMGILLFIEYWKHKYIPAWFFFQYLPSQKKSECNILWRSKLLRLEGTMTLPCRYSFSTYINPLLFGSQGPQQHRMHIQASAGAILRSLSSSKSFLSTWCLDGHNHRLECHTLAFVAIILISPYFRQYWSFEWAALHTWLVLLKETEDPCLPMSFARCSGRIFANDGAALILTPIVLENWFERWSSLINDITLYCGKWLHCDTTSLLLLSAT